MQKFSILPIDLSVETGDITPSLKLKRSELEAKYVACAVQPPAAAMAALLSCLARVTSRVCACRIPVAIELGGVT